MEDERTLIPSTRTGKAVIPVKGPSDAGLMRRAAPKQRARLRGWIYRGWLSIMTGGLVVLLLRLQSSLDFITSQLSPLQKGVQEAELVWLAPVPMALALWLGWFIFVEAIRPEPEPIDVPFIEGKPVRLVFRFVTRGDNVEVLRDSTQAVRQALKCYPRMIGPSRIEIATDRPLPPEVIEGVFTHTYVVPEAYVTPRRSRFKARALAYVQGQVRPEPQDWYIYLDEESVIDEAVVAGIYRFITRSLREEERARQIGAKRAFTGLIGQGAILYHGGHWFFRGADALRTADDLGRFRLQYALGIPLFGVHGSYLVVRGSDDAQLSFDVGAANSVTEDTAWALRAWAKGYRFTWVEGYLREQPPQSVLDFVKQRSRWLSGIRLVLGDGQIPFRCRCCLAAFILLWQAASLPFLVAVVTLFVHVAPFPWMRFPADFAWATFFLAYFQGLDVLVKREWRAMHHENTLWQRIRLLLKRMCAWLLVLCVVWYSLMEALATLYSLGAGEGFFVIHKPSFAEEGEKLAQKEPVAVYRLTRRERE